MPSKHSSGPAGHQDKNNLLKKINALMNGHHTGLKQ